VVEEEGEAAAEQGEEGEVEGRRKRVWTPSLFGVSKMPSHALYIYIPV
jgi:hypothetical protein